MRPASGTLLLISLITLLLQPQPIRAQELSQMLRFEGTPNLDLVVTTDRLGKRSGVLFESAASEISAEPFDRILFNGMLADSNVVLQVSYQGLDKTWSAWTPAFMKIFANGRFWARLDLNAAPARRLRYRLVDRGVTPPARVEIYAVEVVDRKKEAAAKTHPIQPQMRIEYSPGDTIPKPPVISREEWGARPARGIYVPHTPWRFTQHHTAGRRVQTLEDGMAEMRFIQDFHMNGRGWQDIAYHFSVDDSGRIYAGVPPQYRGTHTGGNNTGNIGIDVFGNFEIDGEYPTQESLDALVRIWSWLAFTYGVNPDSLFGHRDYKPTACPGRNFYPDLPGLRNGVRKLLGLGAPYALNPIPQPFSTEISPQAQIALAIRDDEEGVDIGSVVVRVNGEQVAAQITGSADEATVKYAPPQPFPTSQNVVVAVDAADRASTPNWMRYSYRFTIRIEATLAEVVTPSQMRNGTLTLQGQWDSDASDVHLSGLGNGQRLLASDMDGTHLARIYPQLAQTGDYRVFMAVDNTFLGESAPYRLVSARGASQPRVVEYNRVYRRRWGLLSPTPVHFEVGGQSPGYIELQGLRDVPTRLVVDAFRFEKVDRLDPPQPPKLKWVRRLGGTGKKVEVAWYPTLEGDVRGYRLFMSEDGLTWGAPLVDEQTLAAGTNRFVVDYQGSSPTVYFRMVAVDTNTVGGEGETPRALLSDPTDTYGVGFGAGPRILVVDNFDRRASWTLPYHPFVRSHGQALAANGFGFDSSVETAVQLAELSLSDYDLVIYFCGDDSRSDESLAAADQWRLWQYLQNGGKLFISGSEIGYDFAATTAAELQRYHALLKAEYVGDLSGSNVARGQPGSVFEGLEFDFGTANGADTYIEDFPDYIAPTGGSQVALRYGNSLIAAVSYTGSFASGSPAGQLIYLAFPFETVMTAADRAALMGRAMDYFGLVTQVAENAAGLPGRFELDPNYPNPFNASTRIRFALPKPERVQVMIYNLLGQRVATVLDRRLPGGRHQVTWDGRNEQGIPVASGVYVFRMEAGDFRKARRLLLLR